MDYMDINLEYYKIFYYVGKLKGITLAAEVLSISQPAVSQAIKQLESTIGVTLFIRTPKGVRLTSEGSVFYTYIARGYEYMQLGEQKLLELLNLEMGEICIGASDMTLQFYLLPYLEKFHEAFPKIKVTVTNAPTPETLSYMKEGKIDFGVISAPFSQDIDLEYTAVREIEDIFIAGPKFSDQKGKQLDFKQLEQLPIICLESNTSTRTYMDDFLGKHKVVLYPEFELATSDMIVQFVLRNLGIGCVVKDFAEKYLSTNEIFQLQFKKCIPTRNFYIVTDAKRPMSTAARKLLDIMA